MAYCELRRFGHQLADVDVPRPCIRQIEPNSNPSRDFLALVARDRPGGERDDRGGTTPTTSAHELAKSYPKRVENKIKSQSGYLTAVERLHGSPERPRFPAAAGQMPS